MRKPGAEYFCEKIFNLDNAAVVDSAAILREILPIKMKLID
jgi:hypothetical protein